MQLSYQIGVYISRSSLAIIKITKIWILTLIQLVNAIIWGLIAYYKYSKLWVMFIFMIWVGLMGGASYVNIFYQVLKSSKIAKSEKEISINFISIINDFGVFISSFVVILLNYTIYQ